MKHDERETSPAARVVAKAWADDAFKARLIAAPEETLAAEGIAVANGVRLMVVEETHSLRYFVLPAKPADGDIAEQELEGVSGGFSCVVSHYCR